ncbi:hypothetical protein ACI8AA_13085 [Geodermatophilus sp. SYSU D01180]
MQLRVEVVWTCAPCEVGGQDVAEDGDDDPTCWNCGGPVVVTARPSVRRPFPEPFPEPDAA